MKTLIVDDEPSARKGMKRVLSHHPLIKIIGEAHSIETFNNNMTNIEPDLILLDIMLRDTNSLDNIIFNQNSPLIIITTAFDNYALEGFNINAIDYLMKPISEHRLYSAIDKAYSLFQLKNKGSESLFVKSDGRYIRFNKKDILFIKALQNYIVIHTKENKYVCKTTMKSIMHELAHADFIQIHKSYIINLNKVEGIEKQTIYIQDFELPIGKTMKEQTYRLLLGA